MKAVIALWLVTQLASENGVNNELIIKNLCNVDKGFNRAECVCKIAIISDPDSSADEMTEEYQACLKGVK